MKIKATKKEMAKTMIGLSSALNELEDWGTAGSLRSGVRGLAKATRNHLRKMGLMTVLLVGMLNAGKAQSFLSWTEPTNQTATVVGYNVVYAADTNGPWINAVSVVAGVTNVSGATIPNHVWVEVRSVAQWNNNFYQTNPPPVFWDTNPPPIVPVQNLMPHYSIATNTAVLIGPYNDGSYIEPFVASDGTPQGWRLLNGIRYPTTALTNAELGLFAYKF